MAELNTPTSGHKKSRGVQKTKKLSTRVDLTPMVDLGFLLNILNEMTIDDVHHYALVEITPDEYNIILAKS